MALPVHPSLLPAQAPVPESLQLSELPSALPQIAWDAIDSAAVESGAPRKRIVGMEDVKLWLHSEAFVRLMVFIQQLNSAAWKRSCSDIEWDHLSEGAQSCLRILDQLDAWMDEIPPLQQQGRFGNAAFKTFFKRLEEQAPSLQESVLASVSIPANAMRAVLAELSVYFTQGFGNATRLDYGSGHELSFVTWLCALDQLRVFGDGQARAYDQVVLVIVPRYLDIVRRLQMQYTLEPAGSHGVWGLDDHQFLPYLWGSAQLVEHKHIKPKSINTADIVEQYASQYMYLACIRQITHIKHGPFFEHSPMLYDISAVPVWSKVNSGLFKMFVAEVLSKFPIVQHIYFGELLFPFRAYEQQQQ
ncbi:Serine/threonine-protein phosphatase 2A activator 1 [Sorochytrium milnesiophthora]